METEILESDISVLYVIAKSFPDGIMEAFDQIHALVPPSAERRLYGISRPENGVIVYRAAIEQKESGEAEKLNCDTMVLKKGKYISKTIPDFMKDLPAIGCTFKEILSQPGIDPQGYCVEWYMNNTDVKCMVRLTD